MAIIWPNSMDTSTNSLDNYSNQVEHADIYDNSAFFYGEARTIDLLGQSLKDKPAYVSFLLHNS